MLYNYIAIEGNIGAGKTSLSTLLAKETEAELILEEFTGNPFLASFYEEPEKYAFPLEVSFLVDRHQQLTNFYTEIGAQKRIVADYFFDKCLVFAINNLPKDEYKLYLNLHHILAKDLRQPDIILYLHNAVPQLQANISRRGRSFEQSIQDSYLEGIEQSYLRYFQNLQNVRILYLDISEADFVLNRNKYEEIKAMLNTDWPLGLSFAKI